MIRTTKRDELPARLKAYGFVEFGTAQWQRGYQRTDGQIVEILQHATDRTRLPELADNCDLWTLGYDGPSGAPTRVSMANVLAALADPRDEYYLLDLRIENGYGNARAGHIYQ